MTDLNPTYGASFTAKSGQANPDDVLRQIMEENPGSSEKETWAYFKTEMLRDPSMLDACLRYYHVNARVRLEKLMADEARRRDANKRDRKPQPLSSKRERKAASRERARRKVEEAKRIFILDFVMPNGEALRDCTFGYLRKVGGAFAKLATMGKPTQVVGQVLSNDQADAAVKAIA